MDFAFTRDGKHCNQCPGTVHYVAGEALHVHDEPAPDCPAAKQIAANRAKPVHKDGASA
jgi:hypothetical protein